MKSKIIYSCAIVFLLTWIAHAPSLKNQFVDWDDPSYIGQPRIQTLSWVHLQDIFNPRLTPTDPFPEYQPIRDLSLAFDYQIWGQNNPFGFHFTNVFIHSLNAVFLFILLMTLFDSFGVALFSSLLFAIHPVHVESVAWVSSRKDLLGFFFFILSFAFFVEAKQKEKKLNYLLSLLFFVFALLSKSQAVTLPIILGVYYIWKLRGEFKKVFYQLIPFFLIAIGYGLFFLKIQFERRSLSSFYSGGFGPNPIAMIRTFGEYAKLILWPISLSPYYDYGPEFKEVHWGFFISLLLFIGFGVLLFQSWKKQKPEFVGLSFYIVNLLPVLNFLPHPIWVADRYQYFAAPFLYGVIFLNGHKLLNRVHPYIQKILLIILVLSLTKITWNQISVWKDSKTLWTYVSHQFPNSIQAKVNLSNALSEEGKYKEGEEIITQALQIHPNDFQLLTNLGVLLYLQNKFLPALEALNRAISLGPKEASIYLNRSKVWKVLKKDVEVEKDLKKCIEIQPSQTECLTVLGNLLAKKNRFDEAKRYLKDAVQLEPKNFRALYDLGVIAAKEKDFPLASSYFLKWKEAQAH